MGKNSMDLVTIDQTGRWAKEAPFITWDYDFIF